MNNLAQNSLCCFSAWSLSAIFWAIRGALPPARLLMMRLTWTLSFVASFTIFAVSSIISGSSMPRDHLVKGEGLGIGFLVAHPQGSDEPDDHLVSGVEKLRPHLGKLLTQRRQPGPQFGQIQDLRLSSSRAVLHGGQLLFLPADQMISTCIHTFSMRPSFSTISAPLLSASPPQIPIRFPQVTGWKP